MKKDDLLNWVSWVRVRVAQKKPAIFPDHEVMRQMRATGVTDGQQMAEMCVMKEPRSGRRK
jgi:hypothetical protein